MKKIFILLIILLIFTFGCINTLKTPEPKGIDCGNDEICFATNFIICNQAFVTLIDEGDEFYLQIMNPVEDKCQIYFKIKKSEALPEMLHGLDLKCNLNLQELQKLQNNLDIENLDCKGPLYDSAILAKKLGLLN